MLRISHSGSAGIAEDLAAGFELDYQFMRHGLQVPIPFGPCTGNRPSLPLRTCDLHHMAAPRALCPVPPCQQRPLHYPCVGNVPLQHRQA
jgi:hypothetical protein